MRAVRRPPTRILGLAWLACALPLCTSAEPLDRSVPPAPGPAPRIEARTYARFTLPNGLRVFVVEDRRLPLVTFELLIDRPPILEGDATGKVELAAELMRRGTEHRSREQLDEEIDFIGARISTAPNSVRASALTKHLPALLDLLSDIVLHPSFPPPELERIRSQHEAQMRATSQNPDTIAANLVAATTFGPDHPYGEVMTPESLARIDIEDCRQVYAESFVPSRGLLAIVGDLSLDEAKPLVERYFGGWKRVPPESFGLRREGEPSSPITRSDEAALATPALPESTRVAIAEKSGAVQTVLTLAHPVALTLGSDDFVAALVTNHILGGGGRRLFNNLREDKGYTYGAYSSFALRRLLGSFQASAKVRNEVTGEAVREFLLELRRIREELVGEEELAEAKAALIGAYARSLEDPETIADQALNRALFDLPADFYTRYLTEIEAVTPERVREIAQKYIRPDRIWITAVGDPDVIESALAPYGPVARFDAFGRALD